MHEAVDSVRLHLSRFLHVGDKVTSAKDLKLKAQLSAQPPQIKVTQTSTKEGESSVQSERPKIKSGEIG